jgi:hypothetical protein
MRVRQARGRVLPASRIYRTLATPRQGAAGRGLSLSRVLRDGATGSSRTLGQAVGPHVRENQDTIGNHGLQRAFELAQKRRGSVCAAPASLQFVMNTFCSSTRSRASAIRRLADAKCLYQAFLGMAKSSQMFLAGCFLLRIYAANV